MTTITRLTRFLQSFRRFYTGRFAELAARSGLSMREIDVLLFLANHPGQDTARDAVELRGLSKSQVSQAVEVLTRGGFLERRPDSRDRRVVHLAVTDAGGPLAKEAQVIQSDCGGALLEALTEEEAVCFWRLLEKLMERAESLTKEAAE